MLFVQHGRKRLEGRLLHVNLGKLMTLTGCERGALFAALVAVWIARISLWLLPLLSTQRLVLAVQLALRLRCLAVRDAVWAVGAASRFAPSATCLVRALALQAMLAAGGNAATLVIGTGRGLDEELEAHAWVETDGGPLGLGATRPIESLVRIEAGGYRARPGE